MDAEHVAHRLRQLCQQLTELHHVTEQQLTDLQQGSLEAIEQMRQDRQVIFDGIMAGWNIVQNEVSAHFSDALIQETMDTLRQIANQYIATEQQVQEATAKCMAERLDKLQAYQKRQMARNRYQQVSGSRHLVAKLFPGDARFLDDSR